MTRSEMVKEILQLQKELRIEIEKIIKILECIEQFKLKEKKMKIKGQ